MKALTARAYGGPDELRNGRLPIAGGVGVEALLDVDGETADVDVFVVGVASCHRWPKACG